MRKVRCFNVSVFSGAIAASMVVAASAEAQPDLGNCTRYEDQELPPPFLDVEYRFGVSAAVQGTMAAVSAGEEGLHEHKGCVYIYEFNGTFWERTDRLTAPDSEPGDHFASIAIVDEWLAVGAPGDDIDDQVDQGSVYMFRHDGDSWLYHEKLIGTEAGDGDFFGLTLALNGDTLFVSAHGDDGLGDESGAVYVYSLSGSSWSEECVLRPNDGQAGDQFGIDLDFEDDVAIVGAYRREGDRGIAYVFESDATCWNEVDTLSASDGTSGDRFARHLAIEGNMACITAEGRQGVGAAYLFCFDGTRWIESGIVESPDASGGDWFGSSVSMSRGLAAIGSMYHEHDDAQSGAVYVYRYDSCAWELECELLPFDGGDLDRFAHTHKASTATDGFTVLIGATHHDHESVSNSGGAYVYDLGKCLQLTVNTLRAGERATFSVTDGTPGAQCAIFWSNRDGRYFIDNGTWCVDFGFWLPNQPTKNLVALGQFDQDGVFAKRLRVPGNLSGMEIRFQAAEGETCPDDCMSNIWKGVIE